MQSFCQLFKKSFMSKSDLKKVLGIVKRLVTNKYINLYSIVIILLILAISITIYIYQDSETEEYYVKEVIDGDTIVVVKGLGEYRIRYIGIDTPEMNYQTGKPECFAEEAKNFNSSKVLNKKVLIEEDKENLDKYSRMLRYVYIIEEGNKVMINELLISSGYAELLTISPNTKYVELFKNAQKKAKESSLGIWKECKK